MAQYNILEHPGFLSLTSSGTRDDNYSPSELEFLVDGNTTSSGLTVSGTDAVFLQSDLSTRIYIEDIRVYLDSSTSSGTLWSNFNIQYKNEDTDSYTTATKGYNGSYYYVSDKPARFSPRFIRVTFSGIDCDLYEIIAYNNEDIVDFGADGSLTSLVLADYDNALDPTPLPIFNNNVSGTDPINAYVSVDYIDSHDFELSLSSDGPYYGQHSGILLNSDLVTSDYYWSGGQFYRTKIEDDVIKLYYLPNAIQSYSHEAPGAGGQRVNIIQPNTAYGVYVNGFATNGAHATHYVPIERNKFFPEKNKVYFEYFFKEFLYYYGEDGWDTSGSPIVPTQGPFAPGFATSTTFNYLPPFSLTTDADLVGSYTTGTGHQSLSGPPVVSGTVVSMAFDMEVGKAWIAVDGTWLGGGSPTTGSGHAWEWGVGVPYVDPVYFPSVGISWRTAKVIFRLTEEEFTYPMPTGYTALYENQDVYRGEYISPIIDADKYAQRYFHIENYVTESGTRITTDQAAQVDTMQIMSSDTAPIDRNEIIWGYTDSQHFDDLYISSTSLYDDVTNEQHVLYHHDIYPYYNKEESMAHLNKIGTFYHMVWMQDGTPAQDSYVEWDSRLYKYDITYNGLELITYKQWSWNYNNSSWYFINVWKKMSADGLGGVWGYGRYRGGPRWDFVHLDVNLNETLTHQMSSVSDDCRDMAAERSGSGLWYTNNLTNTLNHMDVDGNEIWQGVLGGYPNKITGTEDNGCWCTDDVARTVYRLDYSGNIINTVYLGVEPLMIDNDEEDGFWFITSTYVQHVSSGGSLGVIIPFTGGAGVSAGINGVVMPYSMTPAASYVYNKHGELINTHVPRFTSRICYPRLISLGISNIKEHQGTNTFPASYDPVWGHGGSGSWETVGLNSYNVPKYRFHKLKLGLKTAQPPQTLTYHEHDYYWHVNHTSAPALDYIPEIRSIISPGTVLVQDIYPQESKNVYIRAISTNTIVNLEDIKLRCWWYIEEE